MFNVKSLKLSAFLGPGVPRGLWYKHVITSMADSSTVGTHVKLCVAQLLPGSEKIAETP